MSSGAGEWKRRTKGRKAGGDAACRDSRRAAEAGRGQLIKLPSSGTNAPQGFLSALWRTNLPSQDAVSVQLELVKRCLWDDVKEH